MADIREFRQKRMEYVLDDDITSLDDFKLIDDNNYVLVKRIHDTTKYSGSNLLVMKDWNAGLHAERIFEVAKLPKRVSFNVLSDNCNAQDCDMELVVGDIVFINLSESLNTWVFSFKGEIYHLVRYDSIICAKRGDDLYTVNGNILISPVEEVTTFREHTIKRLLPKQGVVEYLGKPNRDYKRNYVIRKSSITGKTITKVQNPKDDTGYTSLKRGCKVALNSSIAFTGTERGATVYPLEPIEHRTLDKSYFVLQVWKIDGILE